MRFRVPEEWHFLQQIDSGETHLAVFHVRNAVIDAGRDRNNVEIDVLRTDTHANFHTVSDTLFSSVFDPNGIVLADTAPTPNRRFFFWRGQLRKTVYAIYDDYGRRNDVVIHVRMTHPIGRELQERWSNEYALDTAAFLSSITIDSERVFPGWAGHPVLASFGWP
ncbi:MAG: hypothetical protein ABIQ10_16665 [Gemmatimonadaceae bacterium]